MEQPPNNGRSPDERIRVLTTYLTALREEMVERLRLVTRTQVGKMVVVGAIGFAVGKEVKPRHLLYRYPHRRFSSLGYPTKVKRRVLRVKSNRSGTI